MSKASEALTGLGFGAAWRTIRMLPEPIAAGIFQIGADRSRRKNSRSVQQLRRNLRQVVGADYPDEQFEQLITDAVRSYARYWMEAFRLPSWSPDDIQRRVHIENPQVLYDALAHGRGVIIALAHMGNWDLAGAWVRSQDIPLISVAERLKPERVYRRFLDYRRSLGIEIIPLTGGTQPPLDVLSDRLRAGGAVALLADRDLSTSGVEVTFFGAKARMPPGPALLSLRTDAPLLVAEVWHDGLLTRGRLRGPLLPKHDRRLRRIAELTQAMADEFAGAIAAHPSDWHMMQRIWSTRSDGQVVSKKQEDVAQ